MKRSVTTAAPATEPITVSEAKKHLEIADEDTTHDSHLDSLIVAAREVWEHDTQKLLVQRSVTEKLGEWPGYDWRFYYKPVSISSITYFDISNAQQTLATSVYSLDSFNRKVLLQVDEEWPDIESRWDAIAITYLAGDSTVPEISKHAIKLQISMLFGDDQIKREYDNWAKAYENLVIRYQRSSYP